MLREFDVADYSIPCILYVNSDSWHNLYRKCRLTRSMYRLEINVATLNLISPPNSYNSQVIVWVDFLRKGQARRRRRRRNSNSSSSGVRDSQSHLLHNCGHGSNVQPFLLFSIFNSRKKSPSCCHQLERGRLAAAEIQLESKKNCLGMLRKWYNAR